MMPMFWAPEAVPRMTLTSPRVRMLHPERAAVGVAGGRVVRPVGGGDVDHGVQEQGGEGGADQLHHDVAGDPSQGKSRRSAKAMLTAGFRWAPETLPMNKMMAMTIRPGR